MRKRTGFATILSLAAVGAVAMAMGALVLAMGSESRRTMRTRDEAQIEQLLLAGAADVREHASHWTDAPPADWSVAVPDLLARDGAKLTVAIEAGSPSERTANVEAHIGKAKGSQVLVYRRTSAGWDPVSARLMP